MIMTRKHLTRREFLRAGGLLGLGAFFGLRGCELFTALEGEPRLLFRQLEAGCAAAKEEAMLAAGRGKITFSGVMITPNPCYELHAELRAMRCASPGSSSSARCPNTFEVAITAEAEEGYCIECIGSISYQGEIRPLKPGLYTIRITHGGRPVASAQLQVD